MEGLDLWGHILIALADLRGVEGVFERGGVRGKEGKEREWENKEGEEVVGRKNERCRLRILVLWS